MAKRLKRFVFTHSVSSVCKHRLGCLKSTGLQCGAKKLKQASLAKSVHEHFIHLNRLQIVKGQFVVLRNIQMLFYGLYTNVKLLQEYETIILNDANNCGSVPKS